MNDTFLKACRGEKTDYTPVWLMRQAGRYLPEYQEIRSKYDFMTLCKTPELAAEVTLQPVRRLNVDAAILFSDILIPLEPMGVKVDFPEKGGPVLTPSEGNKLREINPEKDIPFVIETIKILLKELDVPLIGFSGAPFTLLTYIIEQGSSKNFLKTKRLMYENLKEYNRIMELLTDTVTRYLSSQIKAGVQAVQLFDTWAGILTPRDFKEYVLPHVKRVISSLKGSVPVIYFVLNGGTFLETIKESGADVIGVDWRIDIGIAIDRLKDGVAVQGNLDPCELFLPEEKLFERITDIVRKGMRSSIRGHIFNLGHGILPETPVEKAKFLVDSVHEISSRLRLK
ncbi:MAG: uroporphyrinogen decarboxylase [Thermodesulfovibrionales bacterium]|nr:uroporphyrinogen decarboxylase [Thermodesulfovibrionales bacterium]